MSSAYGPPLIRGLSDFAENIGAALQNGGWFQGFVDPPRARDDISTRLTPVEPDCGRTIRDKGERGSNRYLAHPRLTEMVNPSILEMANRYLASPSLTDIWPIQSKFNRYLANPRPKVQHSKHSLAAKVGC